MKLYALIPLLLLIALAGCQPMTFNENTAQAGEKGLHVIFFYDKTMRGDSANDYFDALLDVINHSSLHRKQVTIHSGKAADLADRYHLSDCPALIVKNNGVTKVRIEGHKDTLTITKKLRQVIHLKNRSSST